MGQWSLRNAVDLEAVRLLSNEFDCAADQFGWPRGAFQETEIFKPQRAPAEEDRSILARLTEELLLSFDWTSLADVVRRGATL